MVFLSFQTYIDGKKNLQKVVQNVFKSKNGMTQNFGRVLVNQTQGHKESLLQITVCSDAYHLKERKTREKSKSDLRED